jgi:uncharacterized membrane protein YcfT
MLIENPLNESELSFPILECIHIIGFAFSLGTIAIIDFRLLDWWMLHQKPSQLYRDTAAFTLAGIVVMIFSGLLLFSSDPDMYYLNIFFDAKMVFLLLAILFNYTIHRRAALADADSGRAKAIAVTSLGLWGAVIFGGIFLAFINTGLSLNNLPGFGQ